MAVGFSNTNKPLNPRGQDASPKGYNRASLFSGKALDFDGANDSVDLDGFTMAGTTATFVFNVNFDAITINQFVFDLKPVRFVIGLSDITGNPFGLFDNSQWQSFGDLEPNQWYNISISIDGTSAKMYLNGQSFGNEMTMANAIDFDSATEVGVGSNFSKGGGFVNGQMAGFKIFNTALTAGQVADLYNNPEKVVPTGVDNTALKLWLPMMEGAGTTAYDGSGNGNHGTISGATYVNGIGAPVAQSAVIDWNKGSNLFDYSEQFDQSAWTTNATLTSGQSAPDGSLNAYKIVFSNASEYIQNTTHNLNTSTNYTLSCWVKSDGADTDFYIGNLNAGTYETRTATSEWQRFELTQTPSAATRYPRPVDSIDGTETLYIWGASVEQSATAGPYIPTLATAQTSPVLLPQGLTTGRDITGVNLFENVRKQGALNLDGNSWAEVHDNESLDFGTGDFTLEAWAKLQYTNTGSSVNAILSIGTTSALTLIGMNNPSSIVALVNGTGAYEVATIGDWAHIVLTKEGTSCKLYVDATNTDTFTKSANITNAVNKHIGSDSSTIRYYKDQIAQPRIYNRALTASEVLRNYNSGKNTYTND